MIIILIIVFGSLRSIVRVTELRKREREGECVWEREFINLSLFPT